MPNKRGGGGGGGRGGGDAYYFLDVFPITPELIRTSPPRLLNFKE